MTETFEKIALLIREPLRIYRASDLALRRQIWMTNIMVGFVAVVVVSGEGATPAQPVDPGWFTPQMLVNLGFVVYGVGITVQSSIGVADKVKRLERRLDEDIPNTYVRKDVLEERLQRNTNGDYSHGRER